MPGTLCIFNGESGIIKLKTFCKFVKCNHVVTGYNYNVTMMMKKELH